MTAILYYSDLCQDTAPFVAKLEALSFEYQAINITESMKNLKQFLRLRDNEAVFDSKKAQGFAGIPVLQYQNKWYFELDELDALKALS